MKKLITEQQIKEYISTIHYEIGETYLDLTHPPVFICLLNGGFMFFSDLVKGIPFDIQCDFMKVKSYDDREQGKLEIIKDIDLNIKDRNVFIVDDIYDTGNTMNSVIEHLKIYNPLSIQQITLLRRKTSPTPIVYHYYGTEINDEWVVGYGMNDKDDLMRDYPDIWEV